MKRMDIFCASQASTAICMSVDQSSSSSSALSSNLLLGGSAIDRRRTPRALPLLAPCTSQPPPINPKPYHLLQKGKKSAPTNKANDENNMSSAKPSDNKCKKSRSRSGDNDEKFQAAEKSCTKHSHDDHKWNSVVAEYIGRRSRDNPGNSSDASFSDGLSKYHPVTELVPTERNWAQDLDEDDSKATKPTSASHSEKPNSNQVVLRVSLHCRGCEGKIRKHLPRMEGVTSFHIDFAAKKVTIVGDVTPSDVLASVSKVKKAEFWSAV